MLDTCVLSWYNKNVKPSYKMGLIMPIYKSEGKKDDLQKYNVRVNLCGRLIPFSPFLLASDLTDSQW